METWTEQMPKASFWFKAEDKYTFSCTISYAEKKAFVYWIYTDATLDHNILCEIILDTEWHTENECATPPTLKNYDGILGLK